MIIPLVLLWIEHTATVQGRVVKLVPCEKCSTEYVYELHREGSGVGNSIIYLLNHEGAQTHAKSAAEESLQCYLENDFDPVPCPVCGHYQKFMFPKLVETRPLWGALILVLSLVGCLVAVGALYWTYAYLRTPSPHALTNMVLTWSCLPIFCLIGFILARINAVQIRDFDPNREDAQARLAKGQSRAVTREEFERAALTP